MFKLIMIVWTSGGFVTPLSRSEIATYSTKAECEAAADEASLIDRTIDRYADEPPHYVSWSFVCTPPMKK
jgi:hypothetical protein